MRGWLSLVAGAAALLAAAAAPAQTGAAPPGPGFDPALAAATGADERGMRSFVLVILKTGPTRVPDGEARQAMFRGHFDNMRRLAAEGKLLTAGPLDGVDGWRGLYVFATADLDEARRWVASDPVVAQGEMVPELHGFYGSAALVLLRELHGKLARRPP